MRIVDVGAFAPLESGPDADLRLVRVSSADGTAGWGEGRPGSSRGSWSAGVRAAGELLDGRDPRRVEGLVRLLRQEMGGSAGGEAIVGAIDIALHDLVARSMGIPVYDLLGGLYRERVRTYLEGPTLDTETWPIARAAWPPEDPGGTDHRAWSALKVSLTGPDPWLEQAGTVERVLAALAELRDDPGPPRSLLVDLGRRSDVATVMRWARVLEPLAPSLLEVDGLEPGALLSVRRGTRLRLCHGRTLDRPGLRPYLEQHVTDMVVISVLTNGLSEARRMSDLATHHDAMVSPASGVGPIGLLANLQLCAAMPGCETMGLPTRLATRGHDLLEARLEIDGDELTVPDVAGLGSGIREDRLVAL